MNLFFKRLFDILFSILFLILLLPLFFIIAVIIKADSKGQIFFKQERRTKNGKIFKMYKFRSMVVDAEKVGSGLFNYKNDPRITKAGKFLRKTSIDELPQLINVLKGDLSIVGPRPCVIYELGDFNTLNKKYKKRFNMRGGITGLAQIKGRNENSWDEKVEYDNQYIDLFKRFGILIDLKIIFGTIVKVFKSNDIYENKVSDDLDDIEASRLAEEEVIRCAHLPDELLIVCDTNSELEILDNIILTNEENKDLDSLKETSFLENKLSEQQHDFKSTDCSNYENAEGSDEKAEEL